MSKDEVNDIKDNRDCKSCVWRSEDGCHSWDCEYLSYNDLHKHIKDHPIPWKDERKRDLVEVVRCKDCHFFEQNHFDSLEGVPIITAHNICTRWGNGCMTYENGYCFMGIRGERRDATE